MVDNIATYYFAKSFELIEYYTLCMSIDESNFSKNLYHFMYVGIIIGDLESCHYL